MSKQSVQVKPKRLVTCSRWTRFFLAIVTLLHGILVTLYLAKASSIFLKIAKL